MTVEAGWAREDDENDSQTLDVIDPFGVEYSTLKGCAWVVCRVDQ